MDSETKNRGLTAEPFVTLSLSKKCVSKLSLDGTLSKSTAVLNNVNVPNGGTIAATHQIKPTQRNSDTILTPSKRRQRQSMADAAATKPTPSNIIILKYKKTPVAQSNDFVGEIDRSTLPATPVADHTDYLWVDGQTERRSSIASSTDNGTRSSGRLRKLTTKAQALAGTNFLPSLQKTPEIESRASPASITEALNEQTTNHTASPVQDRPINNHIAATNVDEAPIESVESTITRSSNRERKPTVRAIEMESERAMRKRPASPMTTDRATKMSRKSPSSIARPSKLRPTSADAEADTNDETHVNAAEANDSSMIEETNETVEANKEVSQRSPDKNVTPGQMADSPHSTLLFDLTETQHDERKAETKPDSVLCDLSCLSPSSTLLAFARVAANWSDSDDGSEDGDSDEDLGYDLDAAGNDTGEISKSLDKVRDAYCQCASMTLSTKSTNGTEATKGQEKTVSDGAMLGVPAGKNMTRNDDRTANVRASRKAVTRKPSTGIYETETSSVKDRQTGRRDMSLKRQNGSFEQRMKADYLASQQKKAIEAQELGPRRVLSPNRSVRTRASASNLKNSPPRSPNHDHIDHTTNVQASNLGQERNPSDRSIKIDSHSDIIEALISHQQQTPSGCLSEPTASKPEKVKDASGKKTGKINIRGGGKTLAGGSVRLSLRDQVEAEKVKVTKPQQKSIPSQARSIKLKFTTTAAR